jgi:hypothetical protein
MYLTIEEKIEREIDCHICLNVEEKITLSKKLVDVINEDKPI